MKFLIDSNVILDLFTKDKKWLDWSLSILEKNIENGNFVINPIIYAEISCGFNNIEELENAFQITSNVSLSPGKRPSLLESALLIIVNVAVKNR